MNALMNGQLDGCIDVDGWVDTCRRMTRWVDGWMDIRLRCMYGRILDRNFTGRTAKKHATDLKFLYRTQRGKQFNKKNTVRV